MTVRLDNKVVLITGATQGFGRGMALVMAERGAMVVGMARRREGGDELAKEISGTGGSFLFVQGDVTRTADCDAAVQAPLDAYGRLDVLINNAAGIMPLGRLEDTSDDDWQAVVAPTLDGVFRMSRAALRPMRQQDDGVIISISSPNGVIGVARNSAYNSAKAAVIQLMRTIAVENIGSGVRANAVIIGGAVTEMSSVALLDMARSRRGPDWLPDPSRDPGPLASVLMDPKSAGRAIAVLCSDDAREINGATIAIDRGSSAGFLASELIYLSAAQQL